MRFDFRPVPDWPPLAWLAAVDDGSPAVLVFHGARVETREQWFCEAVWAGDFEQGGFDCTDLVAGTGARLREDRILFVPPGSTIDRLSSLRTGRRTWISNSLCCLLAALESELDPAYPQYFRDLRSIMYEGLFSYRRNLETTGGRVELTYFDNLVWNGRGFAVEPKRSEQRTWQTFDDYRDFLCSSMEAMAGNMAADGRAHRYRMLGTLSRGYDSPTVTAIARQVGCEEVLCFTRSRDGLDDNGAPLAPYLKVRPWIFESDSWRSLGQIEAPFIAGDPGWDEIYLRPAEHLLAGKVFLSGYFGDQMWSKAPRSLEPVMRMGAAGLALSEYRLKVGFITCPPPYWGARLLRQTAAISNSAEMRPWDVPGPYSRPICRRIVEGAGVPREMFGQHKMMVAVLSQVNEFLNSPSYRDYLEWLREHRGDWTRRGRIPPLRSPYADIWLRNYLNVLWKVSSMLGLKALSRQLLHPFHLRRFTYPWAVERTKRSYYLGSSALIRTG